ncbi:MAG TPA: hypothetical protein VL860_07745 [Planctomycetota bacterium]|nr:hypothetical protein [Planctomycetota bacterium]
MTLETVLLKDSFGGLRPGPVKEVVDGPHREMHAQPASPDDNMDGWQRKVGHWGWGGAPFECVDTPQGKRLRGRATAGPYDNVSMGKGDPDWTDYRVECDVTLLAANVGGEKFGGPVGLLARFLDSTRHYAAVIDRDGQAKLLRRVVANNWDVLDHARLPEGATAAGTTHHIALEVNGRRLKAEIGGVVLTAEDAEFPSGHIGVIAAQPAEFGPITVSCTAAAAAMLEKRKSKATAVLARKRKKAAQAVLWKKIDTTGFGSGRRIRLGDLDGDGRLDFLLTRLHPKRNPGAAYLAAVDFDGKLLWERGEKPAIPVPETSGDPPAQIGDIDGDGRNEVVCAMNHTLYALDGRTGAVKYSAPMPKPTALPGVYKENINHWGGLYDDDESFLPACAITFADLTGQGAPRDIVLSGHYHQTVALNSKFQELWRCTNVHGHFPIPYRPKGQDRDDILNGYRRVNASGKTVGRVCMMDHQDAIYAGPLDEAGTGPDMIIMAAGEDGLLLLTPGYDIHSRVMGHVQRISLGTFRKDAPGLCIGTVLFHGNRGITSLFDSTFKRLWTKDFPVIGSTLQPVLFDNSGVEYMLLSGIRPSQGYAGGLIDGDGDLVVPLPDDGGPGLCALAQDFDNDGLDELMLWDHDRIWIYHSDWKGRKSSLPRRERPPLYNMSNFQSYYSRPKKT